MYHQVKLDATKGGGLIPGKIFGNLLYKNSRDLPSYNIGSYVLFVFKENLTTNLFLFSNENLISFIDTEAYK